MLSLFFFCTGESSSAQIQEEQTAVPEVIFTSQCSSSPISEPLSPTVVQSSTAVIQSGNQSNIGTTGVKRGRFLIRQQRVKKDGEIIGENEASNETYSTSEYLLTVPSTTTSNARMERHASEPSPSTGPMSSSNIPQQNLLNVASSHTSYLVKQHSHPLLPSQMTSTSPSSYQLTRQLSYPNQQMSSQQQTSSSSQIICSQTFMDANTSSQSQFHHQHHHKQTVRSQTLPHYLGGEGDTIERSQLGGNPTVVLISDTATEPDPNISISFHQSTSMPQQPIHQKQLQLPSIRVKSEELQRSISSPLVSEI